MNNNIEFPVINFRRTTTRTTIIPPRFRDFSHPRYLNVLSILGAQEQRLYGTESLYGDWQGHTLLLLQDWGHAEYFNSRLMKPNHDPWTHDNEFYTNKVLSMCFGKEGKSGYLYASIAANMLKIGDDKSSELPGKLGIRKYFRDVLSFSTSRDSMPNLRAIILFGDYSKQIAFPHWKIPVATRSLPQIQLQLPDRNYPIWLLSTCHPARRGESCEEAIARIRQVATLSRQLCD